MGRVPVGDLKRWLESQVNEYRIIKGTRIENSLCIIANETAITAIEMWSS